MFGLPRNISSRHVMGNDFAGHQETLYLAQATPSGIMGNVMGKSVGS